MARLNNQRRSWFSVTMCHPKKINPTLRFLANRSHTFHHLWFDLLEGQSPCMFYSYPLVNIQKTMEITMLNGKIHYFDWVMFNSYVTNYQRVIFKKIGWLNLPYSIIYIYIIILNMIFHWINISIRYQLTYIGTWKFSRFSSHRIGLWEKLQESPIFGGKNHGFL